MATYAKTIIQASKTILANKWYRLALIVLIPMCVDSLFSFLGFGAVGFLPNYQWYVFAVAFVLMLASLYFVSRKVNSVCDKCL